MRKKHLLMIGAMVLCTAAVIFFCGCRDSSQQASGAAGAVDTVVNVDEPADSQGEIVATAAKTTTKKSTAKTTKKKKKYNEEAPWESFDMYGLPDKLDLLKKDKGDVLVLVNKLHAVSKNYKPTDMVVMDNKLTTWQNLEMKSDAYDAYLKLYRAAKKKGFSLKVCSAYRTYSTQKTLYANAVKTKGRKTANIRSARAGRSEHHTGYAIDITSKSMGWGLKQDFADYPDGKWINDHCHEYGFIIRYPKGKTDITGYAYEPWHLRYVGVEAATEIMEQGITLEEYLGR